MSYTELSQIYDDFMREGPHEQWLQWLQEHVSNLGSLRIADVGCGTGKLTVALAPLCESIIGVDMSGDMLTKAQERAHIERVHVAWLEQDMRVLRLPHAVDGVVSSCDSVNYLVSTDHLHQTFQRVQESLTPGGWFYFDVLGPKRIEMLRDGFWYDLQEEAAVMYQTDVNPTGCITYDVHAFVSETGGLYRRFEEHHTQQYFAEQQIQSALVSCGFTCDAVLGDFGQSSAADADRLIFLCRRRG